MRSLGRLCLVLRCGLYAKGIGALAARCYVATSAHQ